MRVLIALVAGVLLGVVLAPEARARKLEMAALEVELRVGEDGVLHVVERMDVRFTGFYNGIFRFLPYADLQTAGIRRSLVLRIDAVEDGNGNDLEHWKTRQSGNVRLKIRVPGARDAVRRVVIRYRALNVILGYDAEDSPFGGHDELFWNVVGTGWQFPIEQVSVRVHLPDSFQSEADESFRSRSWRGYYGVDRDGTPDALVRAADGVFHGTASGLHPGEAFTVALAFPPGRVAHPGFGTRLLWFLEANWFLLIPLLLAVIWFVMWWRWGRDTLGSRTIIPEFEPPDGLRPSAVGVLLDERLDHRDVTAAIIDLAVRGIVAIKETKRRRRILLDRGAMNAAKLDSFDRALLNGLFPGDETSVRLSSLKYKFVNRLATLRKRAQRELVDGGYWTKAPSGVQNKWIAITIVTLLPVLALGFVFGLAYVGVTLVCAIPMFILARHMSRRSRRGLDALARIRGMQEYMVTAERERMAAMPMDMFEKLLPYAIAFGVHDRWMEAFGDLFEQAPPWYEGHQDAFRWTHLNRSIARMDRDVSRTLYSGPRPAKSSGSSKGWGGGWSGGSGFSGGGFSGGGFGGGGGGGW